MAKVKMTCKFYTRGHCKKGSECSYNHPSSLEMKKMSAAKSSNAFKKDVMGE